MEKKMKIYHVETQEDYDDLMVKLEKQGYKWMSGAKPTIKPQYWDKQRENTAIVLDGFDEHHIARGSISWCKGIYPNAPVIKHKAKGVEQMEKVVVPQFVADWYDSAFEQSSRLSRILSSFANEVIKDDELFSWAKTYMYKGKHDNETSNVEEVIAKMYIYGFDVEVEEEKKYYWRKKKEFVFDFEGDDDIYLNIHIGTGEPRFNNYFNNSMFQTLLTETEAKQVVTEEDFNKLERVEIEDV